MNAERRQLPTPRQVEIAAAVRRHGGHQARAAAELGISRPSVSIAVRRYEANVARPLALPRARVRLDPEAFAANLARAVDRLTPDDLSEGRLWWPRAADEVAWLADQYRVPFRTLAYAAAALSPGLRWEATLEALQLLLDARAAGEPTFPRTGHATFGFRDRAKAWAILAGGRDAWQQCRGPKVEAVVANLLGDLTRVAVDRHIVRAATGSDRRQVSAAAAAKIERSLALLATLRGVRPAELQAALWVHSAKSERRSVA